MDVRETAGEFTLMVGDCTTQDGGDYTITASNRAGSTSCEVNVVVMGECGNATRGRHG